MFKRQRTGSVVCASCGSLVGVNDEQCYTCGRRNPGLWGFAPVLRRLGTDFGFVPLVIYGCVGLYMLSLVVTLVTGGNVMGGGLFSLLSPGRFAVMLLGVSGAYPVFGYGRWWTVLSAGWLHGSALHILFNMMWVRAARPAGCRHLRRRTHGDHLYAVVRLRFSFELNGRLAAFPDLRSAVLRTRSARQRRFLDCLVRWCTTGAAAAAAW